MNNMYEWRNAKVDGNTRKAFELATDIFNLTAPIWDNMSYVSLGICGVGAVIYYIIKKVKTS